jgi:4-diphosphocytidyl-2-C-methyl-D-erythritol kinase
MISWLLRKKLGMILKLYAIADSIPLDSNNIAYKSARLIKETYGIDKGIKIVIYKNIPVAAGLAGGSADAAAVFAGLNRMWNLGLKTRELMSTAARLGSDIPFCILGGTALARGIGDELVCPASCRWDLDGAGDTGFSCIHSSDI